MKIQAWYINSGILNWSKALDIIKWNRRYNKEDGVYTSKGIKVLFFIKSKGLK